MVCCRTGSEKARQNLATQYAVARVLAAADGFKEALPTLFETICRTGGFVAATLWKGDRDTKTLHCVDVWTTGEPGLAEFAAATRALKMITNGRIVSRAWSTEEPVWISDLGQEPMWSRSREGVQLGLRVAVAFPIVVRGEVKGVMECLGRDVRAFDREQVELLCAVGDQIGQFMDRQAQQAQIARLNETLERLASFDSLTGLANRNLLNDRLAQVLAQARRNRTMVAVATVNLDDFKLINDGLGHQAGDELLNVVAARLKSCVREGDTVARRGGDEFVLVLPGHTDVMAASGVAHQISRTMSTDRQLVDMLQRILARTSELVEIAGQELQLTCNIGVSLYPQDGEDGETLLKNAAAALSRAKELGRKSFQFYTAEMNARIARRLSLHAALRRAVERDEFALHYQPKIELVTGRITGVEALLRWNRPGTGPVRPDEFVPLLEETGLIVKVGRWVMEQAINDHKQWLRTMREAPRVAVNVSQVQLARKDFPAVVADILRDGGAPEGALDIEITESLLMEDVEAVIPKLKALRDLGVNISIDDFGTGYSSLGRLTKLPVTMLEIDRSFIREIDASPEGLTIVTTIISLAHSFKLKVIAEGVETEGQRNTLRLLNCNEIQGHVVSAALANEQFKAWWRAYDLARSGAEARALSACAS